MYIVVTKIHQILGIDINDPRITLGEYRIRFSYQEDYAGNPGHFLFWFLSAIIISFIFVLRLFYPHLRAGSMLSRVIKYFDQPINWAFLYNLILIAGYFLFALLFKWQSYNSRLILPLLIAVGPLAGWVSDSIKPRIVLVIFTALFAIGGLRYLLANPSRPLISVGENESILLASRTDVLFYNSPEIRDDYISVVAASKGYDCGSIGLELDSSTPEYLIWYILTANHLPIDQVENISSTLETSSLIDTTFHSCAVFCNICTVIMNNKNYQEVYNRGSLELFVNLSRQ